jgi:hypothetical protein
MGICSGAVIICGQKVEIYRELLENIVEYDPIFTIKYTDDSDHEQDNGEVYKHESSEQWHDVVYVLNKWLEDHFPDITIIITSPHYDCDYIYKRSHLAFKLKISEFWEESTIQNTIAELNTLNFDNYRKVFEILFPDCEYKEPKIYASSDIC